LQADDVKLCLRFCLPKTGDAVDEDDYVDSESDADVEQVAAAAAKKSKAVTIDYNSYDMLYDVDDGLLDDNLPHPKGMIDTISQIGLLVIAFRVRYCS
jgi:hypothetical protein